MPAAAGEAGGVKVAGAGGLRVRGVVHGSVNHLGALSRKTPDARYCNGFPLPSEWAGDVFYGKGTGDRSGLQNLRRTSWARPLHGRFNSQSL